MGRVQESEEASSQVCVELFLSSPQSPVVNRKIQIGVDGVNVRKAPFSQLLLARGSRGLCLFGTCPAAVALPNLEDDEAPGRSESLIALLILAAHVLSARHAGTCRR